MDVEFFAAVSTLLNDLPLIRALLGVILVFFIPGFFWTLVFFNHRQINNIERLVLSFGLSIALVALSIMASNIMLDISINGTNALIIILVVTAIPAVWYFLIKLFNRQRKEKTRITGAGGARHEKEPEET